MRNFNKLLSRLIGVGMRVGGFFLVAMMLLIVFNVVIRQFARSIPGTYEIVEIMIAMAAGFALAYAAYKGGNVSIQLIVPRLPKLIQSVLWIINSLVGMVMWGAITGMTIYFLHKRGFIGEGTTEVLGIPYYPFKCIWIIALILFSLVFFSDIFKGSFEEWGNEK